MEGKEIVNVNFKNSGIKTLKGFGVLFFVVAIIATLIAFIGLIIYKANDGYFSDKATSGLSIAINYFLISVAAYPTGAICIGLSSITKTSLYKRTLLEEKYEFKKVTE